MVLKNEKIQELYNNLLNHLPQHSSFLQKTINHQMQSWLSINTTLKFTKKLGFTLDVHERRNHLFADNSFYFLRTGVQYWMKENITMSLAYAHL